MTTAEKLNRRKKSLLELAQQMGNISKACQVMGYSRQQFYEIRRNFQTYGAEGLIDKLPGIKGPHPNRVNEEIEKHILEYSLQFPTHGPVRVAQELALRGIQVSSGGIRGVWNRWNLNTRFDRLLRLEKDCSERKIELSEVQIKLLERFSPEFRERHIQVSFTGELVAVDTFFVGTLKGVGKVYLQTVLDCFSRYAWARLYPNKLPVTAIQILNNDVLPFFEAHLSGTPDQARIINILSDNGREFCGRPDKHPYELFLQLEDIGHRTTQVRRPQSNGFIERFHRTILDEHLRIMGRKKFYESIDEMQKDLDVYMKTYNESRPHQGRGMNGRTPLIVFKEGLPKNTNETKKNLKPMKKTA
jgi:transposase InsO family protein